MKKISILLFLILFFSFTIIISAQNTYSEEEGHIVSLIYEKNGPEVFAVLNNSFDSLTDDEKFSYCIDKFLYREGSLIDFIVDTEIFSKLYRNMFGEDFTIPQEPTERPYVGAYAKANDLYYIVGPERIAFNRSSNSEISYRIENDYYYFLKDYHLEGDSLKIDIAVIVLNRDPDTGKTINPISGLKNDHTKYLRSAAVNPPEIFEGQYYNLTDDSVRDMNYFSNTVDKTVIDKYSDDYTLYTMTYQKDDSGVWHWTSCVLKNPSTSDKPNMIVIYSLLFISMTAMTLIIYKKKKKDMINL